MIFGIFLECLCNVNGSKTDTCNERGQCECNCNVVGAKCNECGHEFYKFPECHGNYLIITNYCLENHYNLKIDKK